MKILILGGGISGLSAAWYLQKRYPAARIAVLEKSDRLGGWLGRGPKTFPVARGKHLLGLIEEMGLGGELLFSREAKRYVWHCGKLRSIGSMVPRWIPWMVRELFVQRGSGEEESIEAFARRRFGAKVAEMLFDPMTLGVYAGDFRKLSAQACFPSLVRWEQEKGSVVRGMWGQKTGGLLDFLRNPIRPLKSPFLADFRSRFGVYFASMPPPSIQKSAEKSSIFLTKASYARSLFTLRGGMEQLVAKLKEAFSGQVVLDCGVEELRENGVLAGGKFWEADRIISALPGHVLGKLTGLWDDFRSASLWVVELQFAELAKRGFGYLVPTKENERLMGVIWDSAIFPEQGLGRMTAMVREGEGDPIEAALDALKRHMGIIKKPLHVNTFFAKEAIPQFEVGYRKRLQGFQQQLLSRFPTLSLIGNYLDGPSVDTCIQVAKKFATN